MDAKVLPLAKGAPELREGTRTWEKLLCARSALSTAVWLGTGGGQEVSVPTRAAIPACALAVAHPSEKPGGMLCLGRSSRAAATLRLDSGGFGGCE